jgi:hypothetical protein
MSQMRQRLAYMPVPFAVERRAFTRGSEESSSHSPAAQRSSSPSTHVGSDAASQRATHRSAILARRPVDDLVNVGVPPGGPRRRGPRR